MRYKELVSMKLEKLHDSLKMLETMLNQSAPREVVYKWFDDTKEQIENIQTLLNVESQD